MVIIQKVSVICSIYYLVHILEVVDSIFLKTDKYLKADPTKTELELHMKVATVFTRYCPLVCTGCVLASKVYLANYWSRIHTGNYNISKIFYLFFLYFKLSLNRKFHLFSEFLKKSVKLIITLVSSNLKIFIQILWQHRFYCLPIHFHVT